MLWVVPPFLALTLSLVLRLSARVKSHRRRPAGVRPRDPAADHGSPTASRPARCSAPPRLGWFIGAVAWVVALAVAHPRHALGHARPPPRRRRRGSSEDLRRPIAADGGDDLVGGRKVRPADGAVDRTRMTPSASTTNDRPAVEAERPEDAVGRGRPPCPSSASSGKANPPWSAANRSWLSTDCGLMASTCAPTSSKPAMSVGVACRAAACTPACCRPGRRRARPAGPGTRTACSAPPAVVPSVPSGRSRGPRRRRADSSDGQPVADRARRRQPTVQTSTLRGSSSGMSKLA